MGCCISCNKSSPPPKTAAKNTTISKSPPPPNPLPEEETVKEVLSETPTIPKYPVVPRQQPNRPNESPFIKTAPLLHDKKQYQNGGSWKKPLAALSGDDLSELSEICSTLSESVSVSTTVTEKRENYGDELRALQQRSPARLNNRSFSGEVKREKTVGRSPGRRSDPSPNRVRNVTGSGYGRRRDSGESSGRRSRSPATRSDPNQSKTGLSRSQSVRKTGKSPGRVGPGLGERIRKVDDARQNGDSKWPPTSNESLENPLVSLECFIFL